MTVQPSYRTPYKYYVRAIGDITEQTEPNDQIARMFNTYGELWRMLTRYTPSTGIDGFLILKVTDRFQPGALPAKKKRRGAKDKSSNEVLSGFRCYFSNHFAVDAGRRDSELELLNGRKVTFRIGIDQIISPAPELELTRSRTTNFDRLAASLDAYKFN